MYGEGRDWVAIAQRIRTCALDVALDAQASSDADGPFNEN
jgi:hypothetical protein